MGKELLKHEEDFKMFLSNLFDNPRVISDCISRCRRVQKYEGDLAGHYIRDQGKQLLNRLSYSIDDSNEEKQPNHSIPIRGTNGYP